MRFLFTFLLVTLLFCLVTLLTVYILGNIFYSRYTEVLSQELKMTQHYRKLVSLFESEISNETLYEEIEFFSIKWKDLKSDLYYDYINNLNTNFKQRLECVS